MLAFLRDEVPSYLVHKAPQEGDIVLDCGAHFGSFAVFASKKVGKSGKVIAFEPDPFNREILKKNLELNGCNNVIINDSANYFQEGYNFFSQKGAESSIFSNGSIKVRLSSLDLELSRLGLDYESISFVKMDIEGAELEAVEGARNLLSIGKPYLAIASYHLRNGKKTCEHLESRLPDFGYYVSTGFPRHLTTWAWKK